MQEMDVVSQWNAVRQRIHSAEMRSIRVKGSVCLVAVSKTWTVEHIEPVVTAGQLTLGENKLQEGQEKIPKMSPNIEWHYIGGLQRNKVRKVLPLFSVIHSIDSLKLARYTSSVAEELGLSPKVLLQVNIGAEVSKGGFDIQQLKSSLGEILQLTGLQVVGLMCIPPSVESPEEARPYFQQLRTLRDELEKENGCLLPELSMGMSGDFEVAIEEGATLVRVGSSIFGSRNYPERKLS